MMLPGRVLIILPLHPTDNKLYGTNFKTRRRFLSKDGEQWKALAQAEILRQHPGLNPTNQPVRVAACMWLKYDRDVMSVKILLDALTGMVYEDDSLIVGIKLMKAKTTDAPKTTILIENVTGVTK